MSIIYSPYVTGTIGGQTRKIRSYLDYEIAETNTSYSVTFSAGLDAPHAIALGPNPPYPTVTVSAEGQTELSEGKPFRSGNSGDSLQYVPASGTVTWIWEKVATPQSVIITVTGRFGTSSAFKGKTPTVTLPFTVPAGILQPEVNDLVAFRSDASGTSNIEGTYARVQANLVHGKYYDSTANQWVDIPLTSAELRIGNQTMPCTVNDSSVDFTTPMAAVSDLGAEYTVRLITSYSYNGQILTAERSTKISASNAFVIDIMPDGSGIAFGGACSASGFHCFMDADFKGEITKNGIPIGTGGGGSVDFPITVAQGGTGATTASDARSNLGLGNVNNTSDLNKPISTATQTALNGKSDTGHTHSQYLTEHQDISGKVDKVEGKGLSTNDYDTASKTKLDALADIQSIGSGLSLVNGLLSNTGGGGGGSFTPDDYIITHGTSGIWTYELYNSGLAKCYGRVTTTAKMNTSNGGMYVCTPTVADAFPKFNKSGAVPVLDSNGLSLFTAVPDKHHSVSFDTGNTLNCFSMCWGSLINGTEVDMLNHFGAVCTGRTSSSASTLERHINMLAIGRWK